MGIDDKYAGVGGSYMLDENGERVQIDKPSDRFWNDQTEAADAEAVEKPEEIAAVPEKADAVDDAETVEKPEEAAAPEKADAPDERRSWI